MVRMLWSCTMPRRMLCVVKETEEGEMLATIKTTLLSTALASRHGCCIAMVLG